MALPTNVPAPHAPHDECFPASAISRTVAATAGGLTALLGIVAVTGWVAGSEALLRPGPDWAGVQQAAAVAFVLAGTGLLVSALGRRRPGVAVALAAERPLAGLILVTPFDSLVAVAKRYYWYLPVDWMLKHRFDSIALAPRLIQPLLCLIAERDEVIPAVHAERLYAAWGGPKRRVLLPGANHNGTDGAPQFWPTIREFLEK